MMSVITDLSKHPILLKYPDQRINNDAVEDVGELLRQFLLKARRRSYIEMLLFPRLIPRSLLM